MSCSATSGVSKSRISSAVNEPVQRTCRSATGNRAPRTNRRALKSKLMLSIGTGSRSTIIGTAPSRRNGGNRAFTNQRDGSRILLSRLEDASHLRYLGVAEFDDRERVSRIIEKPQDPPSTLAVTGVYFYDPTVFEVITTLKPSERGELEITDVNNRYIAETKMEYDIIEGFWGDAGESIDAYYRVNDFVRVHGPTRTSGGKR